MLDAGLRLENLKTLYFRSACLNPYYVGCWSQTNGYSRNEQITNVLILIMLDAGLRLKQLTPNGKYSKSLNPYYVGCWSQTDKKMGDNRKKLES